jgi:nucleotide-binding universal stress UspA family protein
VGVDASSGAHHAAVWAVHEAARRGAVLELVHVWTPPVAIAHMGAMVLPDDDTTYQHAARQVLDGVVAEVRGPAGERGVAIESEVVVGQTTGVLLERQAQADLLVIGSRGHSGLAGLLLGSVCHQCVHHAGGPVAVVPPTAPVPADGDVVVGVDGSEQSWAAMRWAVDEAGRRHSKLVVVHGWLTPIAVPPVGVAVSTQDREDFEADTLRMLHEMVDGMVEQAGERPSAVELLATDESPAQALIDRSNGAGLVVVGGRGHGGFTGLLLGSVSQKVIHHAESAVIVVR